jgi:hypothetical protein
MSANNLTQSIKECTPRVAGNNTKNNTAQYSQLKKRIGALGFFL